MDRQVEVVAGNHVVVRIAGAVVLVAHHGPGRVRPDSPAMLAAEALAQLVSDAAEQAPGGPGRLVAREVTRWLMRDAEQISPDRAIDLGILSQADTGGVAIFLHGGVTAVLAGEHGAERYRGVDAAFTVDRVAERPARAAALFIDDDLGRLPEVPERGIGSLVEGVAAADGAIVWFEGDRTRARNRVRDNGGAHRKSDASATRSDIELASGVPEAAGQEQFSEQTVDPDPQGADPRLAETRLSGASAETPPPGTDPGHRVPPTTQTPTHAGDPDAGWEVPPGAEYPPRTAQTPPGTGPESPEWGASPGADYPPRAAPSGTGPGIPGAARGTNPAPVPDPELERRLEATARATSITVKVVGFKCARAHPSDPRSAFCTVCGMPVDQTQQPTEVVRPPLGTLVLDDGMTYLLAADAVIGRDPENSEAARRGLVPLKIEDTSGGMSRAHAEIHLVNWDVTVVDRGSTNGTHARPPGYRDWIRLQPHQPMPLVHGAEIMLGNRILRLEPAAPPPFG
ncbi:FHA domain-containing protein [Nocardia wallacei]|uniref:FHA domain-containing protein n=1 Tax=Nocardia wallacei TaxID=480035 RepID=UPI002456EAF8|nr:FHA domain-containing protein [Nocardia wallacei]